MANRPRVRRDVTGILQDAPNGVPLTFGGYQILDLAANLLAELHGGAANTAAWDLYDNVFYGGALPGVGPANVMRFRYSVAAGFEVSQNGGAYLGVFPGGLAPAPSDAPYLTDGAVAGLSAERDIQALASPLLFTSAAGQTEPVQARPTRDAADAATAFRSGYRATTPAGAAGAARKAGLLVESGYDASLATYDAEMILRPYANIGGGAGPHTSIYGGDATGAGPSVGGNVLLRPGTGIGGGATGQLQLRTGVGGSVFIANTGLTATYSLDDALLGHQFYIVGGAGWDVFSSGAGGAYTPSFETFSAATNSVLNALRLRRSVDGGSGANGVGAGLLYEAEASDGTMQPAAAVEALWSDATVGTRTSRLRLATVLSAGALTSRWQIEGAGHLWATADNAYDIGALGATRPRNLYLAGMIQGSQGADVASANDLNLNADSNFAVVTGAVQINRMRFTSIQNGSRVSLLFSGTPTLMHNQAAASGTHAPLLLDGSANYAPPVANCMLSFVYSSVLAAWVQDPRLS